MYQSSVNLAIGQREKNIWGIKSSRGVDFFFFFLTFFRHSSFCVGATKHQWGSLNGNVTPLYIKYVCLLYSLYKNSLTKCY